MNILLTLWASVYTFILRTSPCSRCKSAFRPISDFEHSSWLLEKKNTHNRNDLLITFTIWSLNKDGTFDKSYNVDLSLKIVHFLFWLLFFMRVFAQVGNLTVIGAKSFFICTGFLCSRKFIANMAVMFSKALFLKQKWLVSIYIFTEFLS